MSFISSRAGRIMTDKTNKYLAVVVLCQSNGFRTPLSFGSVNSIHVSDWIPFTGVVLKSSPTCDDVATQQVKYVEE